MTGGRIRVEQRLRIAGKTGCWGMHGDGAIGQRVAIEAADQNSFDRAIERAGVKQGTRTGGLDTLGAVGVAQANDALGGAQSLENAIGEQPPDEFGARVADARGLLETPLAVVGEEVLCLRWQMIAHRA